VIPDLAGDALSPSGLARPRGTRSRLPAGGAGHAAARPAGRAHDQLRLHRLNYADHAAETGAAIPKEPIVFLKSLGALCGPHDDVMIPKDSVKTDWESSSR
jgi:ureidoglycolate lyase